MGDLVPRLEMKLGLPASGVWSPTMDHQGRPREHCSSHVKEVTEALRGSPGGRVGTRGLGTGDPMAMRALKDRGPEQGGS